jgi:hypothetical protein
MANTDCCSIDCWAGFCAPCILTGGQVTSVEQCCSRKWNPASKVCTG